MRSKFKFTNRILGFMLSIVMVLVMLPTITFTASATEPEYDGVIGELYYKVDEENNVTTIFGNGALSSTTALINAMTSNVVIEEGVTSIGNNAFRGLVSLEKLTVNGDVTIGNYAFQGCASLETIMFMGNVTSVGRDAFQGCASLTTIYYYGTTEPSYTNELSYITLYSSNGVPFCGLTPSTPPATEGPCSGDHTGWTELSSLTETVGGCYEIENGGKYYLSDDVRNTTNYRPTIRITCTEEVTLCLNGKTVYHAQSPSAQVISLSDGSTLNLCDCVGTGCIVGEKEILFAYSGATINMYSGTLKDSVKEAVYLMDDASFNMYGGTITGCNRRYEDAAIISYSSSQINIYGGNISGNHKYGISSEGSIYIAGDAKITGNDEGDVYLHEGQIITVGTLTWGADIGVTSAVSGDDIAITGSNTADYSQYFHADNSSYGITNKENKIYLHKHSCTHSATENTITQRCSVCNNHTATATLTATDAVYTGSAITDTATVSYSGDAWSGDKPVLSFENNVNVGTATASITVGEVTASVDFTIAKATPVVTPPTPREGLSFNNVFCTLLAQEAQTNGGTLMYKVNDGEWGDSTVNRKKWPAGTYNVYWKVVGNENYESVDTGAYITVTILQQELDKINPTVTLSSESFVYDGTAKTPDISIVTNLPYTDHTGSNNTGTTVTLEKDKDFTVTYSDNVNAGTATVTIQGIGNFKGTVTRTFTITDKTIPTGTILIKENSWNKFWNTITFGIFCKDYVDVTVTADGTGSGVAKVEYLLSGTVLEENNIPVDGWTTLNADNGSYRFSIQPQSKVAVYVRITDEAGNETVINSDGIVVYEDSKAVDTEATYIYKENSNKDIAVAFNGNTVKSIVCGEKTLAANSDYTVDYESGKIVLTASYLDTLNAGNYTFTVSYNPMGIEDSGVTDLTTTFMLVIDKVDGEVSNINISSKTYDGTAVTAPTFDKLGNGVVTIEYKVKGADDSTYTTTAPKNVGDYVVRVTAAEGTNHRAASATAEFSIDRATLTATVEQVGTLTYNGTAQTPMIKTDSDALATAGVGFLYSTAIDGNYITQLPAFTDAGTYTIYFKATAQDGNYYDDSGSFEVTVNKANYDMTGAKWNYREPFQYDGKEHTVEIVGLPAGVTVESYENNTATAVGDYYAEVNLAYDAHNYNVPTISKLGWTIYNDWTPTEYTATTPNGNGWLNSDFVITANDGYKASLTNTADGDWKDALTYSGDTADGSVTFYLKNETDGTISLAKTVSYKLDKTTPTGKVEFVNRTGWEKFVNTITFDLFFKDKVTVKATAIDNLSGIDKIEYASADKAMTLDEVKAITDWTEYTDSFDVTLENTKKFVYFVRITDNAGNVIYLSTDGAEYDTTAPVIESIENGKTYYTTQKVTVTDKNIDSITLNGETAGNEITLEGNKEATYAIIVTDKAGNETTVTVTMKPIKELAKATDTENTEKVKVVTSENVTPEDKTNLEKAKADLKKALEENNGNYTKDEKKAVEDEIKRIDDALEVIGNVEAVEAKIDKLPENITKNDEAAIKVADDAYNALSNYEKSLVDEAAKKALTDAKVALAELNKPADTDSPQTGDNSNMSLWIALLFISGGAVITLTVVDKKRRSATKR